MLRSGKLARPLAAVWVLVPDNAPLAGLLPIATVTVPVKLVAVFPRLSRAVTCTAGVITAPAAAGLGCTVNTSSFAARGVTLKAPLPVPGRPVLAEVTVYPSHALA